MVPSAASCAARRWARAGGTAGLAAVLAIVCLMAPGCFSRVGRDDTIRVTGSDTMVNLAQAWAEAYQVSHPDSSMIIRGGGSGVGIAALINGKVDIAPSSREMKPAEREQVLKNTGVEPREFIVGTDALAIYVHKQNPIEAISLEELKAIYGEGGTINTWPDLGVENTACSSGEIIRVSRQNNSGTYVYFRDLVLGKQGHYKQGTTAQNGSADVVALISNTPCAIGYSGMGYNEPDKVKMLPVAKKKGDPPVEPTLTSALDGSYPISRPLYIYTLGEPRGAVQEFIQWMLGPDGQRVVKEVGYVPNEIKTPRETQDAGASKSPAETPTTP